MKAKKVLFVLAGIFNCVIGGIGALLGMLIFVLNRMLKVTFESSFEMVEQYVKDLASQDSSYEYLLTANKTEVINFLIRTINIVGVVLLIIGLIVVVFGVVNLLLSSPKYYSRFRQKKIWKVLLITSSWLIMLFNVANILTTIAVCLKDKELEPLYTSSQGGHHA